MAASIPADCIPIIQSYLHVEDFINSRLVSRDFIQKHSVCSARVKYFSNKQIPSYIIKVEIGKEMTNEVLSKAIHLKRLIFRQGAIIGDAGVVTLVNLTNMRVEHSLVTDVGIASLKNLTKLDLMWTKYITDQGIKDLTKMKYLSLYGDAVTDKGVENMDQMEVFVANKNITNHGIRNMTHLRCLFGYNNSNITGNGIKHFSGLKCIYLKGELDVSCLNQLNHLEILKCNQVDHFEKLSLPKLKKLSFQEQVFCPGLNKLVQLEELSLPNSQLYDEDLITLVNLKHLKLGISCANVTNHAIEKMSNLELLSLGSSSITGEGLRKLPKLRSLHLCQTNLYDDDLSGLQLSTLFLNQNQNITNDCHLVHSVKNLFVGRNRLVKRPNSKLTQG